MNILKVGSQGAEVTAWQYFRMNKGFDQNPTAKDFGSIQLTIQTIQTYTVLSSKKLPISVSILLMHGVNTFLPFSYF
jgi:hypothetical protein